MAYAEAGADCLFVPFILDHGAIAELIQAVAPKPVSVVLGAMDADLAALARIGVRRCSTGGGLANAAWTGFTAAAETLRANEAVAVGE